MFYEAMLVSGVSTHNAKVLYFGVRMGGPRWTDQAMTNSRIGLPPELFLPEGGFGGGGDLPSSLPSVADEHPQLPSLINSYQNFDENHELDAAGFIKWGDRIADRVSLDTLEEIADSERYRLVFSGIRKRWPGEF